MWKEELNRLLVRLLGRHAPPAIQAHQEILVRLLLALRCWLRLRPDFGQALSPLHRECLELAEQAKLDAGRDASFSRPSNRNAWRGQCLKHPVFSVLTIDQPNGTEAYVGLVLSLALWPVIAPRNFGATLPGTIEGELAPSVRQAQGRLLTRLRNPVDPLEAQNLYEVAGEVWGPLPLLLPTNDGAPDFRRFVRDINALAAVLQGSRLPAPPGAPSPDPTTGLRDVIDPLPLAQPENQGLAPGDCDACHTVLETNGTLAQEDALHKITSAHQAAGLRASNPPSANPFLPEPQSRQLANAMAEAMLDRGSVLLTQLMALTSAPALSLADAPLVVGLDTLTRASAKRLHFRLVEGHLRVVVPLATLSESYVQPEDAEGQWPFIGAAVLGLPETLSQQLIAVLPYEGSTLRQAFPDALARVTTTCREICAPLRINGTETRLRNLLVASMLCRSGSASAVARTLPGTAVILGTLGYYQSHSVPELFDGHREVVESFFGQSIAPLGDDERAKLAKWSGSQLLPRLGDVARSARALRERTQATLATLTPAASPEECIAGYNALARYSRIMLRMATAARPVRDLFPLPQDLDPIRGRAQVTDKIAVTQTRVLPLPPQGCAQVEQLRIAVRSLAARVAHFDAGLADRMLSTLRCPEGQFPSLPALFVVTPNQGGWQAEGLDWAQEEQAWQDEHPWPSNANRALLVQYLGKAGMRDEWIKSMLGHAEGSVTLGSADCPLVPADLHDLLLPHQTALLETLGLAPIPWPEELTSEPPPQLPVMASDRPAFGDFDADRVERRELSAQRRLHVVAALHAVALERLPDEARLPRLHELLEARLAYFPIYQKNRALRAVDTLLERHTPKVIDRLFGPKAAIRRRERRLYVAPSPFGRFELTELALGERLRQEALTLIEGNWAQALASDTNSALALALLSAQVASAALSPDFARFFASALPNMFGLRQILWMEQEVDGVTRRWQADDYTASLLADVAERWTLGDEVSPARLLQQLNDWLAKLPSLAASPNAKHRREKLRAAMTAWFRHHFPGLLMAHATGLRASHCLPRETWARREGHWVVRTVNDRPAGSEMPDAPAMQGALLHLPRSLASLLAMLGVEDEVSRAQQVAAVEADLDGLASTGHSGHPLHALYLRFVLRLLREGGRLKRALADSTLNAYLAPVRHVLQSPDAPHLLTLEPEEIEEAYRAALLAGGPSEHRRRLLALEMFHSHLQDCYGVDGVDWACVAAGTDAPLPRIDANVVYPHEVARTAALLQSGWTGDQALCEQAELVLHLMHAAGLRFSEAYHRRAQDFTADWSYLRVVRTRQGGTLKTGAAAREIPLNRLSDRGVALLTRLGSHALARGEPDWLFADPLDPDNLTGRSRLSSLLASALRAATGDPNTRLHHLRHTFATESYDALIALPGSPASDNGAYREELFGTAEATRRAAAEWAVRMGHASLETGHLVYLHDQETRVARAASRLLPGAFGGKHRPALETIKALAPWRGLRVSTPPTQQALMARAPESAPDLLPPLMTVGRILRHPGKQVLPREQFIEIFGLAPSKIEDLLEAERWAFQSTRHFRGPTPLGIGAHTPEHGPRHRPTCKRPARLRDLHLEAADRLPATMPHMYAAQILLRHKTVSGAEWARLEEGDLLALVSWLNALGIHTRELELQVPTQRWLAWCQAQPTLTPAVKTVAPNSRGTRLRLIRDAGASRASALCEITQLWLIRAKTILP